MNSTLEFTVIFPSEFPGRIISWSSKFPLGFFTKIQIGYKSFPCLIFLEEYGLNSRWSYVRADKFINWFGLILEPSFGERSDIVRSVLLFNFKICLKFSNVITCITSLKKSCLIYH